MQVIIALDEVGGFSKDSTIPWKNPEDLNWFKSITSLPNSFVIMGRNTWKSLKKGPLPGRTNIVISSSDLGTPPENTYFMKSIEHTLLYFDQIKITTNIFIIGGLNLISGFMNLGLITKFYISAIPGNYDCNQRWLNSHKNILDYSAMFGYQTIETIHYGNTFKANIYSLYLEGDINFTQLLKKIIDTKKIQTDRTGTGTLRLFGESLKYNICVPGKQTLSLGGITWRVMGRLPVTSLRRQPLKNIFSELKWMLSGSTNVRELQALGCHVWDANTTRATLDKLNLFSLPEYEAGPIYGHQWRKFGGSVDQVAEVIEGIKINPTGRRHIIEAWNPVDLPKMALPPCHKTYQFLVDEARNLHVCVYQRSQDTLLAHNWNAIFASMFAHLVAFMTDCQAVSETHFIADAHIYSNHLDFIDQVFSTEPGSIPYPLFLVREDTNVTDISAFEWQRDIRILSNFPRKEITGIPMAV